MKQVEVKDRCIFCLDVFDDVCIGKSREAQIRIICCGFGLYMNLTK